MMNSSGLNGRAERFCALVKGRGVAVVTLSLLAVVGLGAAGATINTFQDDFENGLGKWTDKTPANPQGIIAIDPLNPSNHVLGFSRVGTQGSIFSTDFVQTISPSGQFYVSFDYLGLPAIDTFGHTPGGFFGESLNFNPQNTSQHNWFAGTISGFPQPFIFLTNDGTWHHYSMTFNSVLQAGAAIHLMFENYQGATDNPADAFFDNVNFGDSTLVPEPTLFGLAGMAGMLMLGRRRQRATI